MTITYLNAKPLDRKSAQESLLFWRTVTEKPRNYYFLKKTKKGYFIAKKSRAMTNVKTDFNRWDYSKNAPKRR